MGQASKGSGMIRREGIQQSRLKCNHYKRRYLKKEMPEQPYGESSCALSGELAHLAASLK